MSTDIVIGQEWKQKRSRVAWTVVGFTGETMVRLRSRSGSLTVVAREVLLREYAPVCVAQADSSASTPKARPTFARIRKALEFMADTGMAVEVQMAQDALTDVDALERVAP